MAREKGVLAYAGGGQNRWPAAHVSDVAPLYRLAIEHAKPGAIWHAVDEEGIPMRAIAETLGQRLGLLVTSLTPDAVAAHFGWFTYFATADLLQPAR